MNLSAFQYNRRVLLAVVIAVPLVIAVVFYLVSVELSADHDRAMAAIRHTHEEQQRIQGLSEAVQAAENSARGYLLSDNPEQLLPFCYARIQILLMLPYLERLISDDLVQSQRLVELRGLVHEKFAAMQRLVDLMRDHRREEALQLFKAQPGSAELRLIRLALDQMDQDAYRLLVLQRKALAAKMTVRENLFTVLLFLAAGVVAGAGILMLRIQQLQSLITICAWTQRVNYNGRWMRMEEFLWERFRVKVSHGISEEAFDGVMGIVGKNLTVSDHRGDRPAEVKHDDGRQTTSWG
ncbi:MAG: CHASE3 domain-containing protein [Verrucomicrobia bacterium]|nr:CHASE3 domain-containing protein [Verrucomicrobiota bacterium]